MTSAVMPGAKAERPRLDHVDGMRAIAALIVYVNHAYGQVWGAAGPRPDGPLVVAWWSLTAGHLAVTVFIVISGFCLMLPVLEHGGKLRGGIKQFFVRRARRILPPYYAAVALCLLLIATVIGEKTGTLWDVPLRLDSRSILVHLVLLQDFFATSHINYVFWSIAVEWHIYILMPLMVWCWHRFGALPAVLGALAFGYGLREVFWDTRIARAHPHFVGMFALGMLAAQLARSNATLATKLRERVPWTAFAGLFLLVASQMAYSKFWAYVDIPVGLLAVSMLLASSRPRGVLKSMLSWRPLVFLGTFSYSLYLIHAPFLQVLWQYALEPFGVALESRFAFLMTIGLVLILVASYLFFLAFEAPFLRAARKAPPADTAPAPVP